MTIEALVAIGAGLLARSILLTAFGIDSVIELITGGVLLWRLTTESRGGSLARVEMAENRAAWMTGIGSGPALPLCCGHVSLQPAHPEQGGGLPCGHWSRPRRRHGHARSGVAQADHCCTDRQCGLARGRGVLAHLCLYGGDAAPWPGAEHLLPLVVGRQCGRPRFPLLVRAGSARGAGRGANRPRWVQLWRSIVRDLNHSAGRSSPLLSFLALGVSTQLALAPAARSLAKNMEHGCATRMFAFLEIPLNLLAI